MKTSKAQFYILTVVAVVTIFFFIGRWVDPSNIPDTSLIVSSSEFFTFDNIKEKAVAAAEESHTCNELEYNLQEFRNFVADFALERNYRIVLEYSINSCSGEYDTIAYDVNYDLTVQSERADARGSFTAIKP